MTRTPGPDITLRTDQVLIEDAIGRNRGASGCAGVGLDSWLTSVAVDARCSRNGHRYD